MSQDDQRLYTDLSRIKQSVLTIKQLQCSVLTAQDNATNILQHYKQTEKIYIHGITHTNIYNIYNNAI